MSATPEIKTAIIRACTPNGTWESPQRGTFFRWELVLDDGMPGDILTKENTPPFTVGQEAKLEVHRRHVNGNDYISFRKFKDPNERPAGGGQRPSGGGGGMSKEREQSIARMNAVGNAVALFNGGAVEAVKILHVADQIYAYIESGHCKDLIIPQTQPK